ncbi:MFS transporter [Hydrogenophaga pseudoflava]|uniref:MFS transporter n=1 Tax=Hydrogenophaga pseudoflava TaxID=47421 RepID=UPI0027E52E0A|nr:MFS transporter [Hydrogenophaga pseudoflava]MDQ7747307.1 MFS transporter [Hydrogenophaga pseudoflava]
MIKRLLTYENAVLGMLSLTFGLVFFDRIALTFVLPQVVPELGLSDTQVGLLGAAVGLCWAISGYGFGALADRSGARKSILVAMVIGFSLCTFFTGAAAGFLALLLVRALMGLTEGPVLPIAQSIMAEESSPRRLGFNMGVLQNTSGALLAGLVAPVLMVALAERFGWRQSMYIVAVPGLVMALLLALFLRARRVPGPQAAVAAETSPARLTVRQLLGYRNIWLGVLIASTQMAWLMMILIFAPLYLVRTRGMAPPDMGFVMMMVGLGALLWGLIVPALSDRLGRKPVYAVFTFLAASLPLVLVHFNGPLAWLGAAVFCTNLASGATPIPMSIVPAESVPRHAVASAVGLIMGVAEIIGGVIAPVLAGAAADRWGPALPLYFGAGAAVLSAALALFLIETAPSRRSRETGAAVALNPGFANKEAL